MEKEKLNQTLQAAFKEAALPMIKYLNEHHHPHVTVIITPTGAELLVSQQSTEVLDYVKD